MNEAQEYINILTEQRNSALNDVVKVEAGRRLLVEQNRLLREELEKLKNPVEDNK